MSIRPGGFQRVRTSRMDALIPTNTMEIPVSGGFGKRMVVKLSRKTINRGFVGELGCSASIARSDE